MALINGAQAVLTGFAQGGLPVAILAGVTAAAGLASIMASTYQVGGTAAPSLGSSASGASTGGGGAQISTVSNTSTVIGEQNLVVGVTEVTHMQNKVQAIEESATF